MRFALHVVKKISEPRQCLTLPDEVK